MRDSLGVAVIGAGMAGRAHAAAHRTAPSIYQPTLPPVRLVSIGDVNPEFGEAAARRFGYDRHDTSWQAIAEADDIDVVSVVVATLHREVVQGLLEAGKPVHCEKPMSDTLQDARAMGAFTAEAEPLARIGFTFRRTRGIAYIRDLIRSGVLGRVLHFSGRYWTDYGCSPTAPMSWRYKGGAGCGALDDVGSHHQLCRRVPRGRHRGGPRRPTPDSDRVPSAAAWRSDGTRPRRRVGRLRAGRERRLRRLLGGIRRRRRWPGGVPCRRGTCEQPDVRGLLRDRLGDLPAPSERDRSVPPGQPGSRRLPSERRLRVPGESVLGGVAGLSEDVSLPRCATFDEGVHNMEILAAVATSAAGDGAAVSVSVSLSLGAQLDSHFQSPLRRSPHEARRVHRHPARPSARRSAGRDLRTRPGCG